MTSSSSTKTAMRWMSIPLRSPYTSQISEGVGLGQLSLSTSRWTVTCGPAVTASLSIQPCLPFATEEVESLTKCPAKTHTYFTHHITPRRSDTGLVATPHSPPRYQVLILGLENMLPYKVKGPLKIL